MSDYYEPDKKKIKTSENDGQECENSLCNDYLNTFGSGIISKLRHMDEEKQKNMISIISQILSESDHTKLQNDTVQVSGLKYSDSNILSNNDKPNVVVTEPTVVVNDAIHTDSLKYLRSNILANNDKTVVEVVEPLDVCSDQLCSALTSKINEFEVPIDLELNISKTNGSNENKTSSDLSQGQNKFPGNNNYFADSIQLDLHTDNDYPAEIGKYANNELNIEVISDFCENEYNTICGIDIIPDQQLHCSVMEPKVELCSSDTSSVIDENLQSISSASGVYDGIENVTYDPDIDLVSNPAEMFDARYEIINFSGHDASNFNNFLQSEISSNSDDSLSDSNPVSSAIDSDIEDMCLTLLISRHLRNKRKNKKRRCWALPEHLRRIHENRFNTLFMELRSSEEEFASFFRMSISTFDKLQDLVKNYIQKCDTQMRRAISVEERLAVTLRYLSTTNSLKMLSAEFCIGSSTVSKIVKDTCESIIALQKTYMPKPTTEDWVNISEGFYKNTEFPNCLGIIAGKQIKIGPTKKMQLQSDVILFMVIDFNCNFLHIEIEDGKEYSDYNIFNSTTFCKELSSCLPADRALNSNDTDLTPYVFLSNQFFYPHPRVITPYSNKKGEVLTVTQNEFNKKFENVYQYLESTLSILYTKWAIFDAPWLLHLDSIKTVIKAICVLHNFIKMHDRCEIGDFCCNNLDDVFVKIRRNKRSNSVRDKLADYFATLQNAS